MGKTKLFGRPASKTSSRGVIKEGEESEFVERFKTPSPESRLTKQPSQSKSSSRSYEEKFARRKHVENKAKQLADHKNSLKRRKKHEAARTMVQKIPRDMAKESEINGNTQGNINISIPNIELIFVLRCCVTFLQQLNTQFNFEFDQIIIN